jgi:hypothetical protein
MGLFRWLADQVQESTGEKDRRENVARVKQLVSEYRDSVEQGINELNPQIELFNNHIEELNVARETEVKCNIDLLSAFLSKYGNCKSCGEYAPEAEKLPAAFPKREQERLETYISDIDWSSSDVFWNSFLNTPLGMQFKTRKQNYSMLEQIGQLRIQIDETVRELEIQRFNTLLEQEICSIYITNVRFISSFIQHKIVPEIELVDAFFQAQAIAEQVAVGKTELVPKFYYDISTLVGTPYEKHYIFIRNAFFFYVLSCRIFDTPVLTKLLMNNVCESDKIELQKEWGMLQNGASEVSNAMLLERGDD